MYKMKVLKKKVKLLVGIFIFAIIAILGAKSSLAAQASPPLYIGINELMTEDNPDMGYSIGQPTASDGAKIWNILQYSSASSNNPTEINAFCVKAGVGFSDTNKRATYDLYFDMKTERDAIAKQNSVLASIVNGRTSNGVSSYNALLALFDMAYIPGMSSTADKNNLINQVLRIAMQSTSGYTPYVELMEEYPLTDDDIIATEQAAMWYFTNAGDSKYDKTDDKGWVYYTLTGSTYSPLADYTPNGQRPQSNAGQARSYQMEILYNYFIDQAKANANNYANTGSDSQGSPVTVNTQTLNYKLQGGNYIIGPINITENQGNTLNYDINMVIKNEGQTISNYKLLNSSQSQVSNGTTVNDLVGQNFYISIPQSSVTSLEITFTIEYQRSTITLWTSATGGEKTQPIAIPEIKKYTDEVKLTLVPKNFDLALRKYITKVNDVELSGADSRVPNIDTSTLSSGTTATYKHKKDPVLVSTGDTVTYKLTIYNEGEKAGRPTKIVDQLPTGLTFSRVISGNFNVDSYDPTANRLTLIRKPGNTTNLSPYSGGTLDSETIEIECQVTATPQDTQGTLTNVAWISEEIDEDGTVITNEVGQDRDSEPANAPNVNKDNMSNYKGNDSNKTDLTDKDYFYKGEQDDDDFEKLILKNASGSYDLEIIKVDKDDINKKLEGAEFKITLADGQVKTVTTDENGTITINDIPITEEGVDTITVEELTAPNGYNKIFGTLTLEVTKELRNGEYVATKVNFADGNDIQQTANSTLSTSIQNGVVQLLSNEAEVTAKLENGVVTITIPNEKITGNYQLQVIKVDKDNPKQTLFGAQFKITLPDGSTQTVATDQNGTITINNINITKTGTDTIKVEEITPPNGYNKLIGELTLQVTKDISSGKYVATNVTVQNSDGGQLAEGVSAVVEDGIVKLTVPDEKITGNYQLQLEKVESGNTSNKLSGAQFKITLPDGSQRDLVTGEDGLITINDIQVSEEGTDRITIEETQAPTGYNKLIGTLTLDVTKELQDGRYVITNVSGLNDGQSSLPEGTTINFEEGVIKLVVANKKQTGSYKLQVVKVDKDDTSHRLEGAQFKITLPDGTEQTATTDENGYITIDGINITETGTDTIKIEELTAPEGYNKIFGEITIELTKELINGNYEVTHIKIISANQPTVSGTSNNGQSAQTAYLANSDETTATATASDGIDPTTAPSGQDPLEDSENAAGEAEVTLQNGVVQLVMPNQRVKEKRFDLALRKYITKVNEQELAGDDSRVPNIDESTLESGTTATYKHKKDPVLVSTGDIVTYNLTVYNEGEKAGRPTKIVDQLPTGLKFRGVVSGNFELESYDEDTNRLTLKRKEGDTTNLPAYTEGNLSSETIEIECEVTAMPDTSSDKVLTNVAWISEEIDEDNTVITNQDGADRDSEPSTTPDVDKDNMEDYKGDEGNKSDLTDKDNYYRGEQDDDDFEKLVIKPESFDLKLIKRIVAVNNQNVPERIESIDASKLNTIDESGNLVTTADYNLNKDPVPVKKGDIVTYTFRIYNEGTIDGYASEITEDVPEGLEFLWSDKQGDELANDPDLTDAEKEAIEFNQRYLWGNFQYDESGDKIIQISTNYLSKDNETTPGENLIAAFGQNDGTKTDADLSYKEVSVKFKVISNDTTGSVIRNEAEISDDSDEEGNPVDDRDSKPEDWVKYEDDEDYDNIILQSFDLALRKFIIAVSNDDQVDDDEYLRNDDGSYTREPVVDTSKLNTTGENGNMITTAIYNHTKEPVLVQTGDMVVYMLRVYNEGDMDGYAAEIQDHLPPYLEFVDNDFNKQYGWTASEDGRTVTTTYLADELIQSAQTADDGTITLSYKEVPIMCRVTDEAIPSQNITNIADITKYEDENKNPVIDRDSIEGNVDVPDDDDLPGYKDDEHGDYIPGQEDDDDFEKVVVKTFDLALRKWVTQAIVIEDGNQTITETGHQPYDDPEQIVKVEIHRKKLNSTTVKFRYSIRVTNEGEIPGYATEITDYIPQGLKFVAEDNPGWTDLGNNMISTNLLADKLLQPGEYADIDVVLTWINGEDTMGLMENTAEISDDYNDYDIPDKDSTPNNKKPGEDDIDDAPVMLSISTGQVRIYFTLGFVILFTIAGGIILIKKYVL